MKLNDEYFLEGCRARGAERPRTNPYPSGSSGWAWWERGYEYVDRLARAVKAEQLVERMKTNRKSEPRERRTA